MSNGARPPSVDSLTEVFGNNSRGATVAERARTSSQQFVRSQHQISIWKEGATGRRLSAQEALHLVGWDRLSKLADKPAVPILARAGEPFDTIVRRIEELGLDFERVTKGRGWSKKDIVDFRERRQVPFRLLEKLAQALALDERQLGLETGAAADHDLGVRLRTLKAGDARSFSASTVLGLAEAAWVLRRQVELSTVVGEDPHQLDTIGFRRNSNYGSYYNPAWQVGYELAHEARRLLGISVDEPIHGLKEIVETRLVIPVIQLELPEAFAGATIANGNERGIAVNLNGMNANVWVRRMTVAHELGHLLWDPDDRLRRLIVDSYRDVEGRRQTLDYVETRANGFAIEFLAPQSAAMTIFEQSGSGSPGLEAVMNHFGISKTAARYHLENAYRNVDLQRPYFQARAEPPTDDWEAGESLAVPVFRPQTVPVSRRGRFAAYVVASLDGGHISQDTAAAYFGCLPAELAAAVASTRNYVGELT